MFACVPGCLMFVCLALIGIIMYLAGAGAAETDAPPATPGPRPPYWVFPAVLLAVTVILLLLSLVTDG